jgi:hypothetical protein
MWKVMALATTFAGNLTIPGSVANMIVVESARGHAEVGFWITRATACRDPCTTNWHGILLAFH